jgi:hypothetical protein
MRHVHSTALLKASRRHLHFFLSGMYNRLFQGVADYQGEEQDYVHLAADRGKWWAVIKAATNRSGVVLWSNCIKPGSSVRSKFGWDYARRRRHPGAIDTMVNPKWLTGFYVPPKYVPLHSLRNAC